MIYDHVLKLPGHRPGHIPQSPIQAALIGSCSETAAGMHCYMASSDHHLQMDSTPPIAAPGEAHGWAAEARRQGPSHFESIAASPPRLHPAPARPGLAPLPPQSLRFMAEGRVQLALLRQGNRET